jgi:hypothetical protein
MGENALLQMQSYPKNNSATSTKLWSLLESILLMHEIKTITVLPLQDNVAC